MVSGQFHCSSGGCLHVRFRKVALQRRQTKFRQVWRTNKCKPFNPSCLNLTEYFALSKSRQLIVQRFIGFVDQTSKFCPIKKSKQDRIIKASTVSVTLTQSLVNSFGSILQVSLIATTRSEQCHRTANFAPQTRLSRFSTSCCRLAKHKLALLKNRLFLFRFNQSRNNLCCLSRWLFS